MLPELSAIIELQSHEHKMIHNYKRKTDRGREPEIVMKAAAAYVANGMSVSKATADHGVNRVTLSRYSARERDAASGSRDNKALYEQKRFRC